MDLNLHPDLQRLLAELKKELNFEIVAGHRNESEQLQAFISGKSAHTWPRSKHNKLPSEAVDIKLPNEAIENYMDFCKRAEVIAQKLGIKIKLGRDFGFKQYGHLELHDKHKK